MSAARSKTQKATASSTGSRQGGVLFAIVPKCLSRTELSAFRRIDKAHHATLTPDVLVPLLTRLLVLLLPTLGLGSFLVCLFPQLPLPKAFSHGCCFATLIESLTRRLFMLENGGNWARWRPILEMLYHLQRRRPLVLTDEQFGVFDSREAFVNEGEASRQWRILSSGFTVIDVLGQERQLMEGSAIRKPLHRPDQLLPSHRAQPSLQP
mmetsp:Transcript_39949/g.99979  ORF Transcript_39949/g.99979 Transcript_39949/m.99979 type:complete len:209 (-) Transcript_39949:239-865(-)